MYERSLISWRKLSDIHIYLNDVLDGNATDKKTLINSLSQLLYPGSHYELVEGYHTLDNWRAEIWACFEKAVTRTPQENNTNRQFLILTEIKRNFFSYQHGFTSTLSTLMNGFSYFFDFDLEKLDLFVRNFETAFEEYNQNVCSLEYQERILPVSIHKMMIKNHARTVEDLVEKIKGAPFNAIWHPVLKIYIKDVFIDRDVENDFKMRGTIYLSLEENNPKQIFYRTSQFQQKRQITLSESFLNEVCNYINKSTLELSSKAAEAIRSQVAEDGHTLFASRIRRLQTKIFDLILEIQKDIDKAKETIKELLLNNSSLNEVDIVKLNQSTEILSLIMTVESQLKSNHLKTIAASSSSARSDESFEPFLRFSRIHSSTIANWMVIQTYIQSTLILNLRCENELAQIRRRFLQHSEKHNRIDSTFLYYLKKIIKYATPLDVEAKNDDCLLWNFFQHLYQHGMIDDVSRVTIYKEIQKENPKGALRIRNELASEEMNFPERTYTSLVAYGESYASQPKKRFIKDQNNILANLLNDDSVFSRLEIIRSINEITDSYTAYFLHQDESKPMLCFSNVKVYLQARNVQTCILDATQVEEYIRQVNFDSIIQFESAPIVSDLQENQIGYTLNKTHITFYWNKNGEIESTSRLQKEIASTVTMLKNEATTKITQAEINAIIYANNINKFERERIAHALFPQLTQKRVYAPYLSDDGLQLVYTDIDGYTQTLGSAQQYPTITAALDDRRWIHDIDPEEEARAYDKMLPTQTFTSKAEATNNDLSELFSSLTQERIQFLVLENGLYGIFYKNCFNQTVMRIVSRNDFDLISQSLNSACGIHGKTIVSLEQLGSDHYISRGINSARESFDVHVFEKLIDSGVITPLNCSHCFVFLNPNDYSSEIYTDEYCRRAINFNYQILCLLFKSNSSIYLASLLYFTHPSYLVSILNNESLEYMKQLQLQKALIETMKRSNVQDIISVMERMVIDRKVQGKQEEFVALIESLEQIFQQTGLDFSLEESNQFSRSGSSFLTLSLLFTDYIQSEIAKNDPGTCDFTTMLNFLREMRKILSIGKLHLKQTEINGFRDCIKQKISIFDQRSLASSQDGPSMSLLKTYFDCYSVNLINSASGLVVPPVEPSTGSQNPASTRSRFIPRLFQESHAGGGGSGSGKSNSSSGYNLFGRKT